jgi:hypothetical protein
MAFTNNLPHILGALALFCILLLYLAYVIKREKSAYLEKGNELDFWGLRFLIPGWWTPEPYPILPETKEISFKRTDTHYDWSAKLEWFEGMDETLNLENYFVQLLKDAELLFDEQTSIVHEHDLFLDPELNDKTKYECLRIEGTATQYGTERLYLDKFMMRRVQKKSEILIGESISSILNGCVEGPYFDEMIKRITLASEKTDE